MASTIILVANPGSASRKYALFAGSHERASLHFEWEHGRIVCTLTKGAEQHSVHIELPNLDAASLDAVRIFREQGMLAKGEQISRIGLRIVAPSSYFLLDHEIDDEVMNHLKKAKVRAPLHIAATLHELQLLRSAFPETPIVGVSDSAFHMTKPDFAWNYGISLEDADRFEIKRFGYHGLSVSSVVHSLHKVEKLAHKLIVCHLGSGASVTAVLGGKSIDTTMGYSPLEGVVMSTRSGSIDPQAVRALKDACRLDDEGVEDYLNNHSGLLGLGGSSDIRELLRREHDGDHRAWLALKTYVYSIQKAIGQMSAALGGADAILFTGTVGERSAPIRARIIEQLHYLDFLLDHDANDSCDTTKDYSIISKLAHSKPIFVTPTKEAAEIARHTKA
jgi:acetate kinase